MTTKTKAADLRQGQAAYQTVRSGQPHNIIAARHSPRPPGVAPLARATHAHDLLYIHTCADWADYLQTARAELRRYGETTPTLALPIGHDPVAYRWPVSGRNVAIYGTLDTVTLRRLLAALLRDGAYVASGIDTDGVLHTATADAVEVAA